MMLMLLLATGGAGAAIAAWGGSRGGHGARVATVVGAVALLAVLVISLAMEAPVIGGSGTVAPGGWFEGHLVPTNYLRLVVALWALDAVVVTGIAWLIGGLPVLRGLLAGTLAAIAGGAVALGATDLAVGIAAASATGLAAVVVLLAAQRQAAIPAAASELRVALGGAFLLLGGLAVAPVAAALALADGAAGSGAAGSGVGGASSPGEAGAVLGLVALAVSLGVAVRFGAIPFHLRVPRLLDTAPPIAIPLLLGWVPLPLGVVGLAAMDRLVAPLPLPLDGERWLIVGVAIATMAAAALAAFIADDLRHAIGYLVIADGGLVLLGLAALDPAAWGPARIWLVGLAASKTALAAWGAVAESRFETRSLPDLRGWVPHAPILAAGFVLAMVATYGLPGWIVFDARGDLSRLALGSPWNLLPALAGFLTLPVYLRILVLGVGPASSHVSRAAPERVVRQRPVPTLLAEPDPAPARGADEPSAEEPGRAKARGRRSRAGAGAATAGTPAGRPSAAEAGGRGWSVRGLTESLRRDRTELTSAAVLALAILAALTSWGALELGRAAAEPAPIVSSPTGD